MRAMNLVNCWKRLW